MTGISQNNSSRVAILYLARNTIYNRETVLDTLELILSYSNLAAA